VRVFRQVLWLRVGSGKVALSHPTHQRVPRREHTGQAANRQAVKLMSESVLLHHMKVFYEILIIGKAGIS
jgi:hypothetical protein